MNTKHTPGPWRLITVVTTKGAHHDQAVSAANGHAAITMIHDGSEEGQANATIAAAAPDLLAALEAWEAAYNTHDQSEEMRRDMRLEAHRLTVAAIAKATAQQ